MKSGAAVSELFKVESMFPLFFGTSFNIIYLIKKNTPQTVINVMVTIKIFLLPIIVKTKSNMGIIIINEIPVSLERREKKKLIAERNIHIKKFFSVNLTAKYIDRIPNMKHKISSKLLILSTTSVCIGWAA